MLLIWGINVPHLFLTGMSWTSTNTTWQLSSVHRPNKSSPFCIPLISDHFWDSIGGKAASPLLATNRTISGRICLDIIIEWHCSVAEMCKNASKSGSVKRWALRMSMFRAEFRRKHHEKLCVSSTVFVAKHTISNAISLKHKKESRKNLAP